MGLIKKIGVWGMIVAWFVLVAISLLLLWLMDFFSWDNPFHNRKHKIGLLVFFIVSVTAYFAYNISDDGGTIKAVYLLKGIIETLSILVVPAILGIMFSSSTMNVTDDRSKDTINSRVEKINKKNKFNLLIWKFESQKEITIIHNFTGPDMNNEVDEDFIETETISESKVHK